MPKTLLMMPDAENPALEDVLYLIQGIGTDRDRKATLQSLMSVFGGFKVVDFDTNPSNPAAVQTYAIQPGDKNLLLICRAHQTSVWASVTGEFPEGGTVLIYMHPSYATTTEAITGRSLGTVEFPGTQNQHLSVYSGASGMFNRYKYGTNPTDTAWMYFPQTLDLVGAAPTDNQLWMSQIKGFKKIVGQLNSAEIDMSTPSNAVAGLQEFVLKFYSGVYENLLKIQNGGIRVAHGLELEKKNATPAIAANEISRIRYDLDTAQLVWDKGKDSGGAALGVYDLSLGIVDQCTHYQKDLPNPAIGAWGSNYSLVADTARFPFHFATQKCVVYKATVAIKTTNVLGIGETVSLNLLLKTKPEGSPVSTVETIPFTITGAAGDDGYYLASIDFTNLIVNPKTGVWFGTAVTARSGATNLGTCDVQIHTKFRQTAR